MQRLNLKQFPYKNWLWILPWAIIAVIFLTTLPGYTEHDAFNYVSIAKHMLTSQQYLVPFWKGHPYSDKPPLMFWLFVLGWKSLGFNYWWPQLVTLTFATGSVFMTRYLAKQFWPAQKLVWQLAPMILIGSYYWLIFSKQIRVDQLLIFFMLTAISALIAAQRGSKLAWLVYAISIAFGVMAKGPVIFIFALFPALLLPLWQPLNHIKTSTWIGMILLACLAGLLMTLLWVIPAMLTGGKQYSHQILYGQILHRTHLHQHHRGWLFYLGRLPFWLLPWSIYWPFWRGLKYLRHQKQLGEKFCLLILAVGLLVFNVFGQKEPYYLLPLTPIFALFAARVLTLDAKQNTLYSKYYQWPMAFIIFAFSILWLVLRYVPLYTIYPLQIKMYFLQHISIFWPLFACFFAMILIFFNFKTLWRQVLALMFSLLLTQILWYVVIVPTFNQFNDHPEDVLQKVKSLTNHQRQIAIYGELRGLKVEKALEKIPRLTTSNWKTWVKTHPKAWLLTSSTCILLQNLHQQKPVAWYYQGYQSSVSLWRVSDLLKNNAMSC